ncbi:MAG: hypothetical protein RR892_01290 [Lachnospiraceae bacterium]
MGFEQQLKKIINNYKLERHDLLKPRIAKYILGLVEEQLDGTDKNLVVRGVPAYAMEEVYRLLSQKAHVVAFLNQQSEKKTITIDGTIIPIIPPDKTSELKFDGYLIFSYNYASVILQEVIESNVCHLQIPIINLYDDMNLKYGFYCNKSYFEYTDEIDYSHQAMTEAMIQLEQAQDNVEKETCFWELLSVCLAHRDFHMFFKFINENEVPGIEEELENLTQEIQTLLSDIRETISRRKYKYKDIIIHWIDQVPYNELELLPKLKSKISKEWMFNNAFTVTPYTTPTINTIFWKELRGITYEDTKYVERNWKESPLGVYLTKLGYYMEDIGGMEKRVKTGEKYCKDHIEYSICATACYWESLVQLTCINQPLFMIVHTMCETHDPYLSPGLQQITPVYSFNNTYDNVYEQLKISYGYLDDEVEFYSDIIGKDNISIYMSDHGKWEDTSLRRFYEKANHTFLAVTNIGIHTFEKKIFSYFQFHELIQYLIERTNETYIAMWKGCAFLCDTAIYGVDIKYRLEQQGLSNSELFQSYSGIRDDNGKYILMQDGCEHYFVMSNDGQDEIDNPKWQEDICKLKNKYIEFRKEVR